MPLVQLDFPNPLNTSVQIGDIAYFSNPIDYGTPGNPLSGDQWESTTTPHLTSDQGDIIMIGEIITIIPWDGTVSSIICDMPQALFNLYFSNLISGGCVYPPAICSGDCGNRVDPGIGLLAGTFDYLGNITSGQIQMPNHSYFNSNLPTSAEWIARNWFFDNPTYNVDDYKFHALTQNVVNPTACHVLNSDPFYNPLYTNYYAKINRFYFTDQYGTFTSAWFYTANDILTDLITQYPSAGFSLGMTWPQTQSILWNDLGNLVMHSFSGPVLGSCEENTDPPVCTQGSFIMFSKDNKVNLSSALGYYASATLRNDSLDKAELFNVGADIFESSK